MYLRSFGKMHKAKLDAAFKCIHNPSDLFGSPVEIYDWGCGQGTATVCLLDFLKHLLQLLTERQKSYPVMEVIQSILSLKSLTL